MTHEIGCTTPERALGPCKAFRFRATSKQKPPERIYTKALDQAPRLSGQRHKLLYSDFVFQLTRSKMRSNRPSFQPPAVANPRGKEFAAGLGEAAWALRLRLSRRAFSERSQACRRPAAAARRGVPVTSSPTERAPASEPRAAAGSEQRRPAGRGGGRVPEPPSSRSPRRPQAAPSRGGGENSARAGRSSRGRAGAAIGWQGGGGGAGPP